MTAGNRIRKRREELGLTQEELAKKMGYKSRSSVNKFELSREISLKTVRLLAAALDCSESYIMGWEYNRFSDENAELDTELLMNDQVRNLASDFLSLDEKHQEKLLEYLEMLKMDMNK